MNTYQIIHNGTPTNQAIRATHYTAAYKELVGITGIASYKPEALAWRLKKVAK